MSESAVKPTIEFRSPSPTLQKIGKTLSKLMGWTIEYTLPDDPKMVIIFFPHTSNLDVVHAVPTAFALGLKPNWLAKKELFFGPLRGFFLRLGAIPIDRHKKESKVDLITEAIIEADRVILALSPEGTRSKTKFWRSGFYHIAYKAQIPIHFAFIDYPSKTIGAHPGFVPTGNVEADLDFLGGQSGGR